MRRRTIAAVALLVLALVRPQPAVALEVRAADLRASAATVEAAFELRDLLTANFKRLLDQGGVVHLRVQAEVWERRPVWDLLVYPAVVRVVQLSRSVGGGLVLVDRDGAPTTHATMPEALPMRVPIGGAERLKDQARYYARVLATLGTIADREVDSYSDAVFGRPGEANGLGSLGRLVFRRMLQISDYLQSVSAEGQSRVIAGAQLLRR